MIKIVIRFFSLVLCAILAFSVSSMTVLADTGSTESRNINRSYLSLSGIRTRSVSAYPEVTVRYSGGNISGAVLIGGTTYVPTRAALGILPGSKVSYDSKTKTLTSTGGGLSFSVSDGAYVIYANGRPIFYTSPSILMTNGRIYSPLSSVAKALGLRFSEDAASRVATLSGNPSPLLPAERFYDPEAVLWLGRLIYAESGGESLLGQIAVGNIVMNRVKSPEYPATIWGVIFDKKYGVQFSPVANGRIYNTPSYTSTLAAKIVLEGFSLSQDMLFFLEPTISTSHWIPNTRKYVFSIGHHDFYA